MKTIFGFDEASSFLKKMSSGMEERMERAMQKAVLVVEAAAKENIVHGRTDWPALRPLTLARRKDNRILYDQGTLLRSIHSEATAMQGVIGSPLKYAPVHEFGCHNAGVNRDVTIPQRSYLEPAAVENVEKIKDVYVEELKNV